MGRVITIRRIRVGNHKQSKIVITSSNHHPTQLILPMIIATIQSTTATKKIMDLRVGNLKRSIARKSTQNKRIQDERNDALDQ